jgi:hypothetical protein
MNVFFWCNSNILFLILTIDQTKDDEKQMKSLTEELYETMNQLINQSINWSDVKQKSQFTDNARDGTETWNQLQIILRNESASKIQRKCTNEKLLIDYAINFILEDSQIFFRSDELNYQKLINIKRMLLSFID